MSKTRIILILCLISLLLISINGCKKQQAGISQTDPFVGGTTGLLLDFVQDAPPDEVFDSGEFPFDVELKITNDGEYDVVKEKCRVKMKGVKPSDFGMSELDFVKYPGDNLDAKKKDSEGAIIEGITSYVTFSGFSYMGQVVGNTNYPLVADVCYKYGTKVLSQLCVTEDLLKEGSGVCTVNEEKQIFNSGAPVQITEFVESARSREMIAFTFKIVHKGNGEIYGRDSDCDISRANENKVWIDVQTDMVGTECTGLSGGTATSGYVTLYSGERVVRCSQPVTRETDYVKSVNINLEYDYLEDISTTVLVKPVS